MPSPWWLYMLECRGGGIYIGIAIDVDKRYGVHMSGAGARYTRLNPPIRLLGKREFPDRISAAREEFRMKRLSLLEKHQWAWSLGAVPHSPHEPVNSPVG